MPRAIDEEVKEIIDTDVDTTPFIKVANLLVNSHVTCTDDEEILTEIERWLAAHFVGIRDKEVKSYSIGDIKQSFAVNTGANLNATEYGQQAILLDPCNELEKLNKKQASVGVITP